MSNLHNFEEEEEDEIHELINKNQINLSKGNLEYIIRNGNSEIENIKMMNEKREIDKKFKEEVNRNERFQKIRDETHESIRKLAELEMKWSEYKEIEECEELSNALQDYKNSFNEILKSKLNLIQEISEEIKARDEEYVKETIKMHDEIENIVTKGQDQVWNLRESCIEECNIVEEDLTNQISKMIENNNEIIKLMLKNQRNTESKLQKDRMNTEDNNFNELENLRIQKQKEFSESKIHLETEIQNCEKCLEEMKALYLLNAEKLAYNSKVLSDKELEHESLTKDLSKKERYFENLYKSKINDLNILTEKYKKANKLLTKQYESTSRQYKELHNKFEHFEKSDIERYKEIKEMNEKEILELKEKIKKCDQIIHNQQLGVVWKENIEKNISIEENEELEEEKNLTENEFNSGSNLNNDSNRFNQNSKNKTFSAEAIEEISGIEKLSIINILLKEIDFIFDDKVKSDLSVENDKNQLMGKINVIRKVLSIHSIEEMYQLVLEIYKNCKDVTEEEEELMLQEYEVVDEEFYYQIYNPDLIIQLLNKFKEENKKVVLNSDDIEKRKELKRDLKEKTIKEEKKYWENFTKVLSNETINVWNALEKFSMKYYNTLLERQKLIEETSDLHKQNEELKKLLDQYLKIQHGLIIPPSYSVNNNLENKIHN